MIDLDVQFASAAAELPSASDFLQWVSAALASRHKDAELTVRIVDEAESAELNMTYRRVQGPTNVLSFPFVAPPGVELPLLGDIIICAPVVQQEALAQHKTALAHWAHMTVHGCLHLLGHDHVQPEEAECMENLESRILAGLGFADPYLVMELT